MMKKTPVILLLLLAGHLLAQDMTQYQKKQYINRSYTIPYRLLLPLNYDGATKYPLILFLHGSGEKGNNNVSQLVHGGGLFLRDSIRRKYPAIVVVPQCPQQSNWVDDNRVRDSTGKFHLLMPPDAEPTSAMRELQKLVRQVSHTYKVDRKRIYVGGLSLGGMGTYDIVKRNPKLFAAAFPICGAVDTSAASKFTRVGWWVFHGADDKAVSPDFDRQLVAVMSRLNIPVRFTLYPDTGHNCWDKAFDEPDLFRWLFSNSKK